MEKYYDKTELKTAKFCVYYVITWLMIFSHICVSMWCTCIDCMAFIAEEVFDDVSFFMKGRL